MYYRIFTHGSSGGTNGNQGQPNENSCGGGPREGCPHRQRARPRTHTYPRILPGPPRPPQEVSKKEPKHKQIRTERATAESKVLLVKCFTYKIYTYTNNNMHT